MVTKRIEVIKAWFDRAVETAVIYLACLVFVGACWLAVIRFVWKLVF
jgi:hypothetical protein